MFSKIIFKIIKFYQKFISPVLGYHCRFYPTCSGYMLGAIKKYGLLKGSHRGLWRIMRCHPLNKGGVDLP